MQRKWLELSAEEKADISIKVKEWLGGVIDASVESASSYKDALETGLNSYQSCEDDEIKNLSEEERQFQVSCTQEQLNKVLLLTKTKIIFKFLLTVLIDPQFSVAETISTLQEIDISPSCVISDLMMGNLLELCDKKELEALDLAECQLHLLSAEQWQLLNEKGFFKNLSRIDLSNNELATCSVDVIKAICLAFGSARYINLSNNGFNDCAPEIWDAFCNELKRFVSNSSRSPFIEIKGLDPIRQMQLQNALKLPSLKAMCVNYFWHQANYLSPNINMISDDLREGLGFAPRMQQS